MNEEFNLGREYDELHKEYPMSGKKPLIGITANYKDDNACLAEAYYASVVEAGGVPLIIPPYTNREALVETLKGLDALILSGGADIDPRYMNEEPDYTLLHTINPKRDSQELLLARLANDRQLPILGICRGIQTLAAALGGKVHQDIYAAMGNNLLNHDQQEERGVATHTVNFVEDSKLAALFGSCTLAVNSFHHQAVNVVPDGFMVVGQSSDGVIEAMEAIDGRSIIGVQWHPESFIMHDSNRCMMPLFDWLVAEAHLYRRAKELHSNIITVDSHCDTPMLFGGGYSLQERSKKALVDLHKMDEGGLDVVTMVAYLPQGLRNAGSHNEAVAMAHSLLSGIDERVAQCSAYVSCCESPDELLTLKREGKKVIMRGIENGYAIGTDISNVEKFRRRGVVYMTLCHNGNNEICDSARGEAEHKGLSVFGRRVVCEMNRVGMLIDLSHAAESTFYDVLSLSEYPVVCSHSSCKALCDHPRNLSDEQICALAHKGGVVQVTMYSGFLVEQGRATLDDFMLHLEHAIKIAGIEHVGIGTDFDGDGGVCGCADASQLRNITRELIRRGYSNRDIEKIWGGNWIRVLREVQTGAK